MSSERNVFDFSKAAQLIREDIDSRNFTINDCCNYRYQILDQFCASRSVVSCIVLTALGDVCI